MEGTAGKAPRSRPPTLIARLSRLWRDWTTGAVPRPHCIPSYPWAGDPNRGAQIAFEEKARAEAGDSAGAGFHSFEWLSDLRASGDADARNLAIAEVSSWIDLHGDPNPVSWRADILGARLTSWLRAYDFLKPDADLDLRLRRSFARQLRRLARSAGAGPDGVARLIAIKGLIFAGACLPGRDALLTRGLTLLERELGRQILVDGGHVERSPAAQLEALRALVELRVLLSDCGIGVPEALHHAIDRVAPMLRFFRHGDGGLALFNDSGEEDGAEIDAILAASEAKGKPPAAAPHLGFQRLSAERTLVIFDAGAPPPPGLDRRAHAGTLSFEMSVGRERLIVNCGTRADSSAWRTAQRATAAHSTVVVANTNSSELLADGGLGHRPVHVECRRAEADENIWIEASHDGYGTLGVIHHRRLYLSAAGDDLRGEDRLTGPAGRPFALRFHIHPEVQVSLAQNSAMALLRPPRGPGWRLQVAGGRIGLAESVYLGKAGKPRRCEQIVVEGATGTDDAAVKWAIKRLPTKA